MTTLVEIHEPLLLGSSNYYLLRPGEGRQRKLRWVKLLAVGFALLLLWHLAGTCLYMIRNVACFKDNSTGYLCEKSAAFQHSEELTIAWLSTLSLLTIIIILALQNVPGFLGYKAILHQLKFLPSYWTLVILLFISMTRYAELAISAKHSISWIILMGLALNYILRTLVVGFLNYTQLNFLKGHYPTYVFVLSKLTVLMLFTVSLISLLATILELTVQVHKVHRALGAQNSLHFKMINDLLRDFGTTTFRFKLTSFFWQKLFTDDKNILSNQAPLQ